MCVCVCVCVCYITVQLERTLWQSPVDGGAISSRGKLAAAEDTARNIVASLQLRGLKEKFVANPALLENGQVRGLPCMAVQCKEPCTAH